MKIIVNIHVAKRDILEENVRLALESALRRHFHPGYVEVESVELAKPTEGAK